GARPIATTASSFIRPRTSTPFAVSVTASIAVGSKPSRRMRRVKVTRSAATFIAAGSLASWRPKSQNGSFARAMPPTDSECETFGHRARDEELLRVPRVIAGGNGDRLLAELHVRALEDLVEADGATDVRRGRGDDRHVAGTCMLHAFDHHGLLAGGAPRERAV